MGGEGGCGWNADRMRIVCGSYADRMRIACGTCAEESPGPLGPLAAPSHEPSAGAWRRANQAQAQGDLYADCMRIVCGSAQHMFGQGGLMGRAVQVRQLEPPFARTSGMALGTLFCCTCNDISSQIASTSQRAAKPRVTIFALRVME